MKKDTFNLKQYLVENKMTTNSRGDTRHHFGETKLDTRILKEGYAGPDDHGMSEFEDWYDAHLDEFDSEDEAWAFWEENIAGRQSGIDLSDPGLDEGDVTSDRTNDTLVEGEPSGAKGKFLDMISYWTEDDEIDGLAGHFVKGLNSWGAWDRPNYDTILIDGYPLSHYKDDDPIFSQMCADIEENPDYIDMDAYKQDNELDECGDVPNMTLDDQIAEEFDQMEKGLDEAGYTDDEDDYDLSDFDYDIPEDPRAAKAAQKDIAGDTADIDADIEDEPEDAPLDGDEDDEDGEEEPVANEPAAPAGNEITVNDLVPGEGAKTEEMRNNIDILVDLNEFFAEHPTWRLGTLQRDIRTGFREIREFGYKNLYLTPTMQGYDKRLHNTTGRAIIRLRRPESVPEFGV